MQSTYIINNVTFTQDDMERLASYYSSGIIEDALSNADEEAVRSKFNAYTHDVESAIYDKYDEDDNLEAHDSALEKLYDFIHTSTNTFKLVNKASEDDVEEALYKYNFLKQ